MSSSLAGLLASEGGWQDFTLKGGEWAILWLSVAAALLAIAVGFILMKMVLAEDEGTPKMKEIALAIQEGASAYLTRQFKTIAVILVPLAVVVILLADDFWIAIPTHRHARRSRMIHCEHGTTRCPHDLDPRCDREEHRTWRA